MWAQVLVAVPVRVLAVVLVVPLSGGSHPPIRSGPGRQKPGNVIAAFFSFSFQGFSRTLSIPVVYSATTRVALRGVGDRSDDNYSEAASYGSHTERR